MLCLGRSGADPVPHPVAVGFGNQPLGKQGIVKVVEPELVNDVLLFGCCPVLLGFRQ